MGKNNGHENEMQIISELNGKQITELPKHFSWISRIFSNLEGSLVVTKLNNEQKADISIRIGKETRYISIKSGDLNSFHSEDISLFIPFLRSIGVSESTLKTIVFFHYGDKTLDGSGFIRYTSEELRKTHREYFKIASKELGQEHIMRAVIERCIIKGRFNDNYPVDGIYYGTISDGHFINTVSVYKILLRKKVSKT